ncbi:MAG: M15 family metallopeptidase [Erysipelotrichaceae bacterium]|nr:M15 family metallopeptidase [Erysipelotrichaceae bacterium]
MFSRKRNYYSSYSSRGRSNNRLDKIIIVVVVVALVIGIAVWFNFSRIRLMIKGYSFSQQNDILSLSNDDVKEILSHDKMDNIEDWIELSETVTYYDEYQQYYNLHSELETSDVVSNIDNIFTNYYPKLAALGYSEDQVWDLLETADASDLQYLISNGYTYSDIQSYMDVQGFDFQNMKEYEEVYEETQNYTYAVLITAYPFIISSNDVDAVYTITNPDDYTILVKDGFMLDSTYVPEDLVDSTVVPVAPDCENSQLRADAMAALEEMYNDASALGYNLVINSAYRSYVEQQETYDAYFAKYDEVTAASLVAKPGASEHQTGLGVDLTSQSVVSGERLVFGDTDEYQWCKENSYKYGFILRYEEDKADITGIGKEPWHFRYVGVDVATTIYENGWTLEEYCLYTGTIPELS